MSSTIARASSGADARTLHVSTGVGPVVRVLEVEGLGAALVDREAVGEERALEEGEDAVHGLVQPRVEDRVEDRILSEEHPVEPVDGGRSATPSRGERVSSALSTSFFRRCWWSNLIATEKPLEST